MGVSAERDLIASIESRLGSRGGRVLRGPGDDAAVVRADGVAVTSIDTVVDGVHLRLDTHSAADVGHKALATALSDLAAMGAEPGEAYVSLALPGALGAEWAMELVDAMEALAERTATTIAGGDVVGAERLTVTVAVTGWADSEEALVYRDGARPGHLVGVTGELGGSGAGLLLVDGLEAPLDPEIRSALVRRHRRPEPLLVLGRALADAGAEAMIDVSDGVATDAGHLAAAGNVAVEVQVEALPLAPGATEVARAAGREPRELAASAGDDYELLFTAPDERRRTLEEAARGAGSRLSWIGTVEAGAGLTLRDGRGEPLALRGFEHL